MPQQPRMGIPANLATMDRETHLLRPCALVMFTAVLTPEIRQSGSSSGTLIINSSEH